MAKNVTGADIFGGMFRNIPAYEKEQKNLYADFAVDTNNDNTEEQNKQKQNYLRNAGEQTTVNRSCLHPFHNHPYRVVEDDSMQELAESIRIHGIKEPLIVRPRKDNDREYEIISGHRRNYAAGLAKLNEVPARIFEMDDDTAAVWMVDSNLKRETLLPSEKAWAYRIKAEAQRNQGKRNDLLCQNQESINGMQTVSEENGKNIRTIQRYIRLTYLIDELMELVDTDKLPVGIGYTISFFNREEQDCIFDYYKNYHKLPGSMQAAILTEYQKKGMLDAQTLAMVLQEEKPVKWNLTIKNGRVQQYFPKDATKEYMEEVILKLLEKWAGQNQEE